MLSTLLSALAHARRTAWYAAPSEADEVAYWEDTRVTSFRMWGVLVVGVGLANAIWWPLDAFVFSQNPALIAPVARIRGVSIVACGAALLLLRWFPALRRHATMLLVAVVAFDCAVLGHEFACADGSGSPWFPLIFPIAIAPSVVPLRPAARVAVPVAFAVASSVSYFGSRPEYLASPTTVPLLSYLSFMVLMSIVGGLITDYLRRQGFFLRRTITRLNETLESRVDEQTSEVRLLSAHRESVREQERARIARELHDELGQELTALRYALKFLRLRWEREPGEIRANIDNADGTLARVTAVTRGLVHDLRPKALDDLGLFAAAEQLAHAFQSRTGIACHLAIAPDEPELPPDAAVAAFRILQEALTNAARHADAKRIDVSLALEEQELRLVIRDDGKGFAAGRTAGMGLIGMRERARALGGQFELESRTGEGTKIVAVIPCGLAAAVAS